jgi:Spy/CpxP family protein refolding chaperone
MCHPSWARRRARFAFSHRGFGHESGPPWAREGQGPGDDMGSEGFGVRRPLRFLAYKLELDEKQIELLARILDELKTERAQAAVDDRRSLSDFADGLSGDAFDAAKVGAGADRRVESSRRLRDAVLRALQQIHAILNPDQRGKLAYLIRTGVLQV